jgi:hypothetical protein
MWALSRRLYATLRAQSLKLRSRMEVKLHVIAADSEIRGPTRTCLRTAILPPVSYVLILSFCPLLCHILWPHNQNKRRPSSSPRWATPSQVPSVGASVMRMYNL